jgi:hypothetical protein
VDGKPADIVKANVLFRAVQVGAGKHLLRFDFRPFKGAIAELSNDIFEDKPVPTKH